MIVTSFQIQTLVDTVAYFSRINVGVSFYLIFFYNPVVAVNCFQTKVTQTPHLMSNL